MKDFIISSPWTTMYVVIITQVVFLYFRTLNIMYVAEKRKLLAILTGNGIAIAWLISITIGINAIQELQWQPMLGHLIGGTIGTWLGFKTRK